MYTEEKYNIILEYTRIAQALGPLREGGFNPLIFPVMHELMDIITPKSILEIGFNAGHGSLAFLLCTSAKVFSIDITENQKSEATLIKEFGNRFSYIIMHSSNLSNLEFEEKTECDYDLVYIDAEHSFAAVRADIKEVLKFNPEYILFDDWENAGVTAAIDSTIEDKKLEIVKTWSTKDGGPASWCLTKVLK